MVSVRGFARGVVVAGIAVALSGCSGTAPPGDGAAPESPAAPPSSAGVYAYLRVEFGDDWAETASELVVMDGAEEIGRSEPLFLATRPVFTADGRYAFTMPSLLDEIVVVSADSGETRSVPCEGCGDRQADCDCQFVAPIGGSRIAWLDGDHRLVVTDLADASPAPRQTDITLRTEDGFLDERVSPSLIAGTDGAALAAYPHGSLPGDDLMPAYLVTLDGEPRRLETGRPDSIEEAAFSPDGTRVALTGSQEYACATVTVVDVASGRGETAPVSAEPGTTCDAKDVYIDSLWWDRDGGLNVTCEADDENATAADGQRRLEGGRWVDAGTAPAGEVRRLDDGTATIEGDGPGTLVVESDGERAEIDTDVRYVTAAP
ncbi:hypothetical protein [Streptomyces sp. URMC 129]|uniref:hypothetical protein n=1 Tax=Streptomyces sp. URMC 129 TaxID=3423407 RepID=UPI003F1B2D75